MLFRSQENIGGQDLKTKIFILLAFFSFFSVLTFAKDNRVNIFLTNYFEANDFHVEEYKQKSSLLYFAYKTKDNNEIFQRGILFDYRDGTITPLLFFNGNEIYNSGELLVSPEVKTQQFYGWKIILKEQKGKYIVYTSFYTDNGEHVTDGVVLIKEKKEFVIRKPDASEY